MIVDDEQAIVFALSEYFGVPGYAVDTAAGMHEAEALLARGAYEILLTDLSLDGRGGTEGLALAALVRQRHPRTRIIILTAYGSREAEAAARRLGVDAFLHKPTPLREIAQVLEHLLQKGGDAGATDDPRDRYGWLDSRVFAEKASTSNPDQPTDAKG